MASHMIIDEIIIGVSLLACFSAAGADTNNWPIYNHPKTRDQECFKCPPGFKLEGYCDIDRDKNPGYSTCVKCTGGEYSSSWTEKEGHCWTQQTCSENENILSDGSSTMRTVCGCKQNMTKDAGDSCVPAVQKTEYDEVLKRLKNYSCPPCPAVTTTVCPPSQTEKICPTVTGEVVDIQVQSTDWWPLTCLVIGLLGGAIFTGLMICCYCQCCRKGKPKKNHTKTVTTDGSTQTSSNASSSLCKVSTENEIGERQIGNGNERNSRYETVQVDHDQTHMFSLEQETENTSLIPVNRRSVGSSDAKQDCLLRSTAESTSGATVNQTTVPKHTYMDLHARSGVADRPDDHPTPDSQSSIPDHESETQALLNNHSEKSSAAQVRKNVLPSATPNKSTSSRNRDKLDDACRIIESEMRELDISDFIRDGLQLCLIDWQDITVSAKPKIDKLRLALAKWQLTMHNKASVSSLIDCLERCGHDVIAQKVKADTCSDAGTRELPSVSCSRNTKESSESHSKPARLNSPAQGATAMITAVDSKMKARFQGNTFNYFLPSKAVSADDIVSPLHNQSTRERSHGPPTDGSSGVT